MSSLRRCGRYKREGVSVSVGVGVGRRVSKSEEE